MVLKLFLFLAGKFDFREVEIVVPPVTLLMQMVGVQGSSDVRHHLNGRRVVFRVDVAYTVRPRQNSFSFCCLALIQKTALSFVALL